MTVFPTFHQHLEDMQGTDMFKLNFALESTSTLTVGLVSQLKRWSCVMVFDSIAHLRFTGGAPSRGGYWFVDRLLLAEMASGMDRAPLDLDLGTKWNSEAPYLCLRTFGGMNLEIVAGEAVLYTDDFKHE